MARGFGVSAGAAPIAPDSETRRTAKARAFRMRRMLAQGYNRAPLFIRSGRMRIRLGPWLVVGLLCVGLIVSAAAHPLAHTAPPPEKHPLLKLPEPWPTDEDLPAARAHS